jgi:hypothetical protein
MDTKKLTDERGNEYGHPKKHFSTTRYMFRCWELRRMDALKTAEQYDPETEAAYRHAVYMILDKLARAANRPKKDTLDDVQGYARTAKMILGMEK